MDFLRTNKIRTVKKVSFLIKFQRGSDHRIVRPSFVLDLEKTTKLVLDLKLESLN